MNDYDLRREMKKKMIHNVTLRALFVLLIWRKNSSKDQTEV